MTEMAEKIYELFSTRRHVSFAELSRMIPGFQEEMAQGITKVFCLSETPQLIIWINLSDEALEALDELRKSQKVFLNPCSPLVYMADGVILNFPVLKRMPRKDVKKDYWVPYVLDIEPLPSKMRKKARQQQGSKAEKIVVSS